MKKILGSIRKSRSGSQDRSNGVPRSTAPPQGDGPDAIVYREVTAFCESGAPGSQSSGDEYLHLPAIVDGAESSPSAATQAALRIRTYLGKDHYDRGFAQYNAIMLTRILTDNPGRVFTQNFDKDFVSTVRKLLREGKDTSVQQILRETLDYFEASKSQANDTLGPLMDMWRKEKGMNARIVYPRSAMGGPPLPSRPKGLPPPDELAGRIEEAKTTARLLVQTVQSTPQNELLTNDLVREFADRARAAQKSIQGYMNAENPHPDDDTMLTLIETTEQLNVAMSKHQRAVLQARKGVYSRATPSPQPRDNIQSTYMTGGENVYNQSEQYQQPQAQSLAAPALNGQGRSSPFRQEFAAPAGPPPGRQTNSVYSDYQLQGSNHAATTGAPAPTTSAQHEVSDNPFSDEADIEKPQQQNYSLFGRTTNATSTAPQMSAHAAPGTDDLYDSSTGSPTRPTAYNQGFVSTPSYMHRQDSAAAHLTMHGASPPPETQK